MKLHRTLIIAVLLVAVVLALTARVHAQDTAPVVHAVLFYSRECGHCQYVITQVLPPLFEKYGSQLQIIGFDVAHPQGQALFAAAAERFGIQNPGVPFLVIDNLYLVGSNDIPDQLPGLVETYLKVGGVGWPDIPGLEEILVSAAEAATAQATVQPATTESSPGSALPSSAAASANSVIPETQAPALTWMDRFGADPVGNTVAVVVLLGLIASLVWAVLLFQAGETASLLQSLSWTIPWLCLLGAAVAAYLAFVELTQTAAVCGPVGDCNTVQTSEYARLFGVLPIGVPGIIGYLAIGLAWIVARATHGLPRNLAALALFVLPAGGTLFSIYLTFLEPFIIGATCAWCLISSLVIAAITLLGVTPARLALSELTRSASSHRRRAAPATSKGTR